LIKSKTSKHVNTLPLDNVKLHNMHVLKNTPLEDEYRQGEFRPLELEEYTRRASLFLQYLRPDIAVHRLAAVSSRRDELISPAWTGDKMRSYQFALDYMKRQGITQGMSYAP
jgi:radical SAM superfamily enzyme